MTKIQKMRLATYRRLLVEDAIKAAEAMPPLGGPSPTPEQVLEARIALGGVRYHHRKIVELVSDAHCGDCGAHESEPCAETCGEKMTEGA